MTTINISLPEPMRAYVEAQAALGHYTASEYLRHLIRQDQRKREEEGRGALWDLLAISARQLDDGDFANVTVDTLLAQGRQRRKGVKV